MDQGDIAVGGPGSGVAEGGVLAPQETVAETTKYETTNPTRYNNGVLEEKYNGEWWEVETDAVTDANAGVYAAGQDHPGAQPATIVGKNAKMKSKAAGPGDDSSDSDSASTTATTAATAQTSAAAAGTTTAETTTAASAGNFSNPGAQVKAAGDYSINETDANGKVIASNGRLSISSDDDDE